MKFFPEAFPPFIPEPLPELPVTSVEPDLLPGDEFAEPDSLAKAEGDEGEVSSFQCSSIPFSIN